MKRILFTLVIAHWSLVTYSQCTSLRYQDTIFHSVTNTTAIYFGTATPYGLLAQPQDLYLDIYEPANDTLTHRPLIVFQFGGGFTIGWRTEPTIPQFCDYFARCGYVVATIDYRIGLNPLDAGSTVRAFYRGIQDERSAIRYLCAHAQQYKIDTAAIFLTGTSAGCFCAFASAYMNDSERPSSTFGTALEPDDLGCMDCSGNTDFNLHIPHIKGIIDQWGAMLDTNYIEASENVPTIIFHGDQDNAVPYIYGYPFQLPVFPPTYGGLPIHVRMDNAGILNELHPLVGFGHEPELLNPELNDTIYNYSRPFLYRILKPVTSDITGTTEICEGETATYSVVNTIGSKYCWQLSGSGNIIYNFGNSIEVIWSDTGNVSVSVRELNIWDASGDEKTFSTYVIPHATANFTDNVNELFVSLQNLSSNYDSLLWNFGDAFDTATATATATMEHTYLSGGAYNIKLTSFNNLCSDSFSKTITIDSCPKANISFTQNGLYTFLNTNATNTQTYQWYFGDGDSAFIPYPNVLHQYFQDGNYTVTLIVKNQLGCEAIDTATISISITSADKNDEAQNIYVQQNENGFTIYGLPFTVGQRYLVETFDLLGRKIAEEEITTRNQKLQTENPSSGTYFLRISNSSKTFVKKVTFAVH